MDLKHLVIRDYQECINLGNYRQELKDALKTNERVPKFIDSLTKQISDLPPHLRPDRVKLKKVVYDVTDFFVQTFLKKCEQDAMSELKKSMLRAEEQKRKDLDATTDGKPQGEYKELLEDSSNGENR